MLFNAPTTPSADQMTDQAMETLQKNDHGGYCVPTEGLYPFQWNWDSALTALGWARFARKRAVAELDSLFSGQWEDGMLPHILFHQDDPGYFPGPSQWACGHKVASSGITQPPVVGFALKQMCDGLDKDAQQDLLSRFARPLHRWHRWWHQARDPENTGLVAIYHPWESGRDNSVEWDAPLEAVTPLEDDLTSQRRDLDHVDADQRPSSLEYRRYMALVQLFRQHDYDPEYLWKHSPFRVADIGINALLINDMRCLADLLDEHGLYSDIVDWSRDRIARMTDAKEQLYSPQTGLYHSLDLHSGELQAFPVSACWLALMADLPFDRSNALLKSSEALISNSRWSMPSLAPDHPAHEGQRYWRGPVWAIVNRLLADGFARHGEQGAHIAHKLRQDTADLIQTGGFAEYFDPTSGAPLGGRNFTWTAAMWLHWRLDQLAD